MPPARSSSSSNDVGMCPMSSNPRLYCEQSIRSWTRTPRSPGKTMDTNQPNIECIHVTTVDIDRQRYDVAVEIEHDGVEYRGRLRFTDEAWADDEGVADFGTLPGRRVDEVVAYAQSLSDE